MFRTRSVILACLLIVAAAASAEASPGCPGAMLFKPDASGGLVDAGWTGIAHQMPALGYSLRMETSCSASAPPCGTCAITGLVANAGGNNLRCRNDTSHACTVATEATDCGAPSTCRFFLSPPTPVSSGGVSSCYTSEVTGTVGGTVDVDSGAMSADIPFQANLFNGLSIDSPCPRCMGDPAANDNVRGGACNGGPRNGLPCDANATAVYPDFGSTSFDCPPTPASQIATFILGTVTFATGTQSATITAASPLCTGFIGPKCQCDTCNNAANQVCRSDADCPISGGNPGVCGGRRCLNGANAGAPCTATSQCPGGGFCGRPGEATKPNPCLDDTTIPGFNPVCTDTTPTGDGEGECINGPVTTHCSLASGHPQRGCTTPADCDGSPGSCVAENRICYLDNGALGDSIDVSGIATPPVGNTSDPTMLGALACLAPTSAGSVNNVGGFPGLARSVQPGALTFAEEVVVHVTPPGGTATTDGSGPASVVETSVTTPTGGEVTIVGTFNAGAPPSGYEFLGRLVQITAPTETPGNPLSITFHIAASEVPVGQSAATIAIFRNNVGPIPDCLGSTQAIPDDPCISARNTVGGGDVEITVLTSAASDWTMATTSGSGPNKCAAGKEKCVAKKEACLLGCHAKAENGGAPFDPSCQQKCFAKFDGGVTPSKGCFAKLEAKYGAGCLTSNDTSALEATTDAFVLDAVTQLDPAYPAPVSNKCSAGKKKCVSKKAACKLGCYSKAHGKGIPVDTVCLGKCEDTFDGGATPSKGCFAKLEAKYLGGCFTINDTGALESTVDAFVGDVVCQLHGPSDGTCP